MHAHRTDLGAPVSAAWQEQLAGEGLRLDFGAFAARIRSRVRDLPGILSQLYSGYPLLSPASVCDMHVAVERTPGLRAALRGRVSFSLDGVRPTDPAPQAHAPAILEWGMNLGVALRGQHLLMLHSGSLERNGGSLLLPAGPGSGKSTLTAALCNEGWRLLSDEFGLIDPETGRTQAMPRPVGLKNASIDVIRGRYPDAVFGPAMHGTPKGTVAHMRAPAQSVRRLHEDACPRMIVFPRWEAGSPLRLRALAPGVALRHLVTNAFNYPILGETGFDVVTRLVADCRCHSLVYSELDEAIAALGEAFEACGE